MRRLLLPALLTLATAPLLAQMPTTVPGTKAPARVIAGNYAVDPAHTLVGWRVNHLGFNDYFGIFGDVTGTLSLDPKKPEQARLDVTIPVAKITTVNAALTAHLLKPAEAGGKPDFFGAAPAAARFVSTAIAASGTRAKITGNLTLNGVTRPVTLDAEFTGAGKMDMAGAKDTVGFEAKAAIKRSEFGLGNGIPMVSDAVELDIAAAFELQ